MAITKLPRADADPFRDPRAPSLATVLATITAMAALPPRHRADLCSAVRSLGQVLGKTPAEIPAEPGVLGRLIRRAMPAAAGVNPRRWANIKSLAIKALHLSGCKVMPSRSLHPLTPAWAELDALLPTRYFRAALSRLMHFCSAQGIEPAAVDQAVFDRFGAAIMHDSFIRNQRIATRPLPGCGPGQPRRSRAGLRPRSPSPATASPMCCVWKSSRPRSRPMPRPGCGTSPAMGRSRMDWHSRCGRARSSSAGSTCGRRLPPWSTAAAIPPPSPASPIWSRSRRCRRSCASSWRAAATARPRRSMASPPTSRPSPNIMSAPPRRSSNNSGGWCAGWRHRRPAWP